MKTKHKESPIESVFCNNLKFYLTAAGSQQKDLAEYCEVTPTSVFRWINGKGFPQLDKIDRICDFLGITRSQLVSERTPGLHIMRMSDQDMEFFTKYDHLNIAGKQKASEYIDFLVTNPANQKESRLNA